MTEFESQPQENLPITPYADIENEKVRELLERFDSEVVSTIPDWPLTATPVIESVVTFLNIRGRLKPKLHALVEYLKKEQLFDFPRKDYRGKKNIVHYDQNMARIIMLYGSALASQDKFKEPWQGFDYGKLTEVIDEVLGDSQLGSTLRTNIINAQVTKEDT